MESQRRDRLIQDRNHDTYRMPGKLPEPARCQECGAVFRKGRWVWAESPAEAGNVTCPACHRTRDGYPAGRLQLVGRFAQEHREELIGLARNVEEREKREHPLKRIMAVRDEEDVIHVETTDPQLARSIGDALQRAYEGELEYHYEKAENHLRVRWQR